MIAASRLAAQATGRGNRAGERNQMRTAIPRQSKIARLWPEDDRAGRKRLRRYMLAALVATACALAPMAAPARLAAQTPTSQNAAPATASTPVPVHKHKRPSAAHPAAATVPDVPAPAAPPVPETPKWPAFEHAAQASVVWDSQGLSIDAANSSLQQILTDVSTATGVKVEGMASDQRVFGVFGPGKPRDVLSQLLQGSGYNVIMIGDRGQGTPRQILLSARQNGTSPATARTNQPNEDEDADDQPVTQEPEPPVRPAFPPGMPPRSPQQIMQEMQQRQQEMQRQPQQQPQ